MQDFKRVLEFNIANKRRIDQPKFFDWLSNVKNLILSKGCKHVRNEIQWDQNTFSFQKLTKIAHCHRRLWAPPPDPRL